MIDTIVLVICIGFAGFVSGLTGFAFALIASGTLITIRPPIEAASLVLVCSIISQTIAIVRLKIRPPWRTALVMIIPGLVGSPIGVYLLHDLDPNFIKISIGVFLISYSMFLACLDPSFHLKIEGLWADGAIGFLGGVLGGIGGLSGALPTAWSLIRDWDPRTKRAIYQSFALVMQIWSLIILSYYEGIPSSLMNDLMISIPILLLGVLLGLFMFARINQGLFRTVIIAFLGALGLTTTVLALPAFGH